MKKNNWQHKCIYQVLYKIYFLLVLVWFLQFENYWIQYFSTFLNQSHTKNQVSSPVRPGTVNDCVIDKRTLASHSNHGPVGVRGCGAPSAAWSSSPAKLQFTNINWGLLYLSVIFGSIPTFRNTIIPHIHQVYISRLHKYMRAGTDRQQFYVFVS